MIKSPRLNYNEFFFLEQEFLFFLPRFVGKIYCFSFVPFMLVCCPVHGKPFLDLIYEPKKKRSHFSQFFAFLFGVSVDGCFLYYEIGTM